METIVTIKNGEATFDVVDGQGEECRQKNQRYYNSLREKFGLPLVEDCKPEMELPTPEADTNQDEGELL